MGEIDKNMEYQKKCLAIAMKLGDKGSEGLAYGNIAKSYQYKARYHDSIEFNRKYLKAATEIESRDGQGQAHFYIGKS